MFLREMIPVPNSLQFPRRLAHISSLSGEFSVSHIYFFFFAGASEKQENIHLRCQFPGRDSSPGYPK
jgi:hypothetical protein